MTRTNSTSAKPIGYYCKLPLRIEKTLGSYFENLDHNDQVTLFAALARYVDYYVASGADDGLTLFDAYMDGYGGSCTKEVEDILDEIQQLPDYIILHLCEALIANLLYTKVC